MKTKEDALVAGAMFHIFSEKGEEQMFNSDLNKLSQESRDFIKKVMNESLDESEVDEFLSKSSEKGEIAETILNLTTLLEKTKNQILLFTCMYLVEFEEVRSHIKKNCIGHWEEPLVINRSIKGEQLLRMWELCSYRYRQTYGTSVRKYGKNKNAPTELLNILFDFDNDEPLRRSIAFNPQLDRDLSLKFMNSKRKAERIALAQSKYADEDLIEKLTHDKYEDIRMYAQENLVNRKSKT